LEYDWQCNWRRG